MFPCIFTNWQVSECQMLVHSYNIHCCRQIYISLISSHHIVSWWEQISRERVIHVFELDFKWMFAQVKRKPGFIVGSSSKSLLENSRSCILCQSVSYIVSYYLKRFSIVPKKRRRFFTRSSENHIWTMRFFLV